MLPDLFADSILGGTCLSLVLSKKRRNCEYEAEKITVKPTVIRDQNCYQFTVRTSGRETHENLSPVESVHRLAELFGPVFEDCHCFDSAANYSARIARGGSIKVRKSRPTMSTETAEHNRTKAYLIPDDVICPFLVEIGVMTKTGKVRAAKYHKFRQINRFLELVDDVLGFLPEDGMLNIVDFGCGHSYLTFALHHLLTNLRERSVQIIGLDRSADVIRDCSRITERLGCEGLEFRVGDIADYASSEPVHLVVSLHACDTATDDALARAVSWNSDVILAVPCCQHELARKVHNQTLCLVEQHGILKQRFAALATDSLRAQALEISGYKTQVIEFIDMEHTSKNLLIRAIRRGTGQQSIDEKIETYRNFKGLLGVEQIYLEEALGTEFSERVTSVRD